MDEDNTVCVSNLLTLDYSNGVGRVFADRGVERVRSLIEMRLWKVACTWWDPIQYRVTRATDCPHEILGPW